LCATPYREDALRAKIKQAGLVEVLPGGMTEEELLGQLLPR
jgi:hypothetical protein